MSVSPLTDNVYNLQNINIQYHICLFLLKKEATRIFWRQKLQGDRSLPQLSTIGLRRKVKRVYETSTGKK